MIEISKNRREVIRVRLREFKGRRFVDARVFYPGPDGEVHPSSKGVSIPLDLAGELGDAIREVARQEQVDAD